MNKYDIYYEIRLNQQNITAASKFIRFLENGMGFKKIVMDIDFVMLYIDQNLYNEVIQDDLYHNELMFNYVNSYLSSLSIRKVKAAS